MNCFPLDNSNGYRNVPQKQKYCDNNIDGDDDDDNVMMKGIMVKKMIILKVIMLLMMLIIVMLIKELYDNHIDQVKYDDNNKTVLRS